MTFELTYDAIAKRIDHSLLGPTLTTAELVEGCELAVRYGVASVCIKPAAVALAAKILKGSPVAVGHHHWVSARWACDGSEGV